MRGVSHIVRGRAACALHLGLGVMLSLAAGSTALAQTQIYLQSGAVVGPPGTPDPNVRVVTGPYVSSPTHAQFLAARNGAPALITTTNGAWVQALPNAPGARWINDTGNSTTGHSALYAIDFFLPNDFTSASGYILIAADDIVDCSNDVYVNEQHVFFTVCQVGDYTRQWFFQFQADPFTSLVHRGLNTLYFNVRNVSGDAGLIFSEQLDVAVTAPPPVAQFRTGNSTGGPGSPDTLLHMLVGPADGPFASPFTPTDFTNARGGPHPLVTTPNGLWVASLPSDGLAKWVNDVGQAVTTGSTGLYAVGFQSPPSFYGYAALHLDYMADDQLGNAAAPGLYVNGHALSGTDGVGDFHQSYSYQTDISPYLSATGTNTLYVYDQDNGGPSGLILSGTVTYLDVSAVPGPGPPLAGEAFFARPNPAIAGTHLHLEIAGTGRTTVEVCDIEGRVVRVIHDGVLEAGPHEFRWDGTDATGRRSPAGVYLATARTGNSRQVARVALLR